MSETTEPRDYLIWSHEHAAWWGPGGRGYVSAISEAGRYSRGGALQACVSAIAGTADRLGALPEIPVRLADLDAVVERFTAKYPGKSGAWR